MRSSAFALKLLWLVLFSLPVVVMVVGMARYNVAVPFSDDLYMGPHIERVLVDQDFSLNSFVFQLNEHLVIVPFILAVVVTSLFGWSTHVLLLVNPILALLNVYFIYKISKATHLLLDRSHLLWLGFITLLLTTSLTFWEVWSHSFTINIFLVNTLFLLSVFFLTNNAFSVRWFWVIAIICFVASFTGLHGLATWLALIPFLWVVMKPLSKRVWLMGLWICLWMANCLLYISLYTSPERSADLLYALSHPVRFAYFYFIAVAGPLVGSFMLWFMIAAGAIMFFLFFVLLHKAWGAKHVSIMQWMPWFSIWLFGAGSTLALTIGRAGPDILWRGVQSRFGLFSLFMLIALMYIGALVALSPSKPPRSRWYFLLATCVLVAFSIDGSYQSLFHWESRFSKLIEGRSCLLVYEDAKAECLEKIGNSATDGERVRSFAPTMDRLDAF